MQLAILTAVLAALASAENGGGPVAGLAWRLLVVASAALVAPLAALVGTQQLAASIADDDASDDAIARLQTLVVGLWLAAVGVILLVAQWPRIVRDNWQLADWPLVDELAILLPVIAPLLLVWPALYRLERAAQIAACNARQLVPPPPHLSSYVWFNIRHQLGLALLPPLAALGVAEFLRALKIGPAQLDAAWWFMLPLVAAVLVLMPAAVRRIWRTTSLSGPLRELLDGICHQQKCSLRDILVWHTDGTMANAAVVGLSRWLRYMLLTDALLARLSTDQITAVVRHELAHLRRWHLPLRLALLLLPVAWWMAIAQAWPDGTAAAAATLEAFGIRAEAAGAFAVPLAMLAYAAIVLGWYSRLLEYDADLEASLNDDGHLDPIAAADFCGALVTLCGGARETSFSQWLHPPVQARVAFLRRVANDPEYVAAFRQRLFAIALSIAALYLAAVVVAVSL